MERQRHPRGPAALHPAAAASPAPALPPAPFSPIWQVPAPGASSSPALPPARAATAPAEAPEQPCWRLLLELSPALAAGAAGGWQLPPAQTRGQGSSRTGARSSGQWGQSSARLCYQLQCSAPATPSPGWVLPRGQAAAPCPFPLPPAAGAQPGSPDCSCCWDLAAGQETAASTAPGGGSRTHWAWAWLALADNDPLSPAAGPHPGPAGSTVPCQQLPTPAQQGTWPRGPQPHCRAGWVTPAWWVLTWLLRCQTKLCPDPVLRLSSSCPQVAVAAPGAGHLQQPP